MSGTPRFLVIRRDNIGDLVCTTPLIAALRERYPHSHIAALVNSYNRDVLANDPRVDALYAYDKAKHLGARGAALSAYLRRARMLLGLRRARFDYAILAAPRFQPRALRLARLAGAGRVIGFVEDNSRAERAIDLAVPYGSAAPCHEVQDVFRLLAPLGIEGEPPAMRITPDPALLETMQAQVAAKLPGQGPLVAVHISARRASQRWPTGHFAELIALLAARHRARIALLWAPGEASAPTHPGDDRKARELAALTQGLAVLPVPTFRLAELIAALAACDYAIGPDGGTMHLAAALGKPQVCLFGDSPPERWRPWKAPHELLQPAARHLDELAVEEVLAAFERLARAYPMRATGEP